MIILGIASALFVFFAGVFVTTLITASALKYTVNNDGKFWALPLWVSFVFGVTIPVFCVSVFLAGTTFLAVSGVHQ